MQRSKAWLSAGLALAGLAPLAASGQEAAECGEAPCAAAPAAGGQIAIIDPETGELAGDGAIEAAPEDVAAEIAEFNAQMSAEMLEQFSSEGLEEQRLESGAVGIDLDGRFMVPMTVVIGPDGTPHFGHGAVALPEAD